jgi:hypothetical protein
MLTFLVLVDRFMRAFKSVPSSSSSASSSTTSVGGGAAAGAAAATAALGGVPGGIAASASRLAAAASAGLALYADDEANVRRCEEIAEVYEKECVGGQKGCRGLVERLTEGRVVEEGQLSGEEKEMASWVRWGSECLLL